MLNRQVMSLPWRYAFVTMTTVYLASHQNEQLRTSRILKGSGLALLPQPSLSDASDTNGRALP